LVVIFAATRRKIPGILVDQMAKSGKPSHIIYSSISIADTGVGARGEPPTSLEPGMIPSFARARARGSQRELTTPMRWEKWEQPAIVKGDRCGTTSPRILSCVGRGTGLDQGEGEFTSAGSSNVGAGLVALFPLALWICARLQGVPASPRTGFNTASKMRLFQGWEFHSVPFSSIHLYVIVEYAKRG
jgi:hypothetical protein